MCVYVYKYISVGKISNKVTISSVKENKEAINKA